MKTNIFFFCLLAPAIFFISCGSAEDKSNKDESKEDSLTTDEAEMPVIDEVEMEYVYQVTNSKTKKTVQMSQEEYLESGIWENPDMVITEIPLAK